MYHVSAQGVGEHMINVHYYYLKNEKSRKNNESPRTEKKIVCSGICL